MGQPGRALDLGLAALLAAQLGAAAWLSPAGDAVTLPDGTALPELCLVHAALAIDCPMCGMTRSFVALAHGELAAALRFHPAGPLLFAAMAVFVAAAVAAWVRRARPVVARRGAPRAFVAVALACVVLGVGRSM
ncbi:MAG TPA: DUF2752 domain-containing protein [Kofleriaceae bacterium]|nr:DUF2752 domain-containing protein [Kofleriaceae bacterium]